MRTVEAILAKNEEILDGLDRRVLSAKQGEQMGQCLKIPIGLARLETSFLRLLHQFGRKAPVPRSAILRSVIGLKEAVSPTDGEYVRRMLPE